MSIEKTTKRTARVEVNIGRLELLKLLRPALAIPETVPDKDVAIYVVVPGGGDWSNIDLPVDENGGSPLLVSWVEYS